MSAMGRKQTLPIPYRGGGGEKLTCYNGRTDAPHANHNS
jgi:hypothetical protein